MVSFDSFDEMYKFARAVDEGIKSLEDKVKNPEQLRYGDEKANLKANLCLDSIEEELLNIEVEVGELLERETEELLKLTKERDEFAKYVSDIETHTADFNCILAPYGYKHRQPQDCTPVNNVPSSSMFQSGSSLLENVPFPSTGRRNVSTYERNSHTCNSPNSAEYEDCSTPDLFEKPKQYDRNNTEPVFNCTVENYEAEYPSDVRTTSKKDDNITKANNPFLSQTYMCTSSDSVLSNLSYVNNTFNEKAKLKNDIKTPKANKSRYKSVQLTTPPDPGFSSISQQVYRLNIGRLKQALRENENMENGE